MANELNLAFTTGRTITARLILGGAYVGSSISCPEAPASSGHYSGSVPGGTGAGHYSVVFLEDATVVGAGSLLWDGTAERTALTLPTATATAVRTELGTELARIDETVSSRQPATPTMR